MPRPKSDLTTHHINLYAGEFEELSYLFPAAPPAKVIRELVHELIIKARANDPDVTQLKVTLNV